MSNLDQDDLTKEIYRDFYVSPRVDRILKLVCLFLWLMAVQQCAKLYFRPIASFDIPVAIGLLVLAGAFNLYYLWASKSGFMDKVRKKM